MPESILTSLYTLLQLYLILKLQSVAYFALVTQVAIARAIDNTFINIFARISLFIYNDYDIDWYPFLDGLYLFLTIVAAA